MCIGNKRIEGFGIDAELGKLTYKRVKREMYYLLQLLSRRFVGQVAL